MVTKKPRCSVGSFRGRATYGPYMGVSVSALLIALSSPVLAQSADADSEYVGIEEVVVTSTRRVENLQDVPVAVSALNEKSLSQLRVDEFTDYLTLLPGVTAGGSGPGQNNIYIRGLASTTTAVTVAGAAGLAPNVALYLDDQPVSQPGRNLDVYAADMERIEVLAGPQGTLFGASSQAGTVRLITNKPKLGVFEAIVEGGVAFTKGGEMSQNIEGVINVPATDSLAIRGVVYVDNQGGYIDNVPGTRTAAESARFRPVGTPRFNGLPVGPQRAGSQSTADLSGVNFLTADNSGLVEENFNDTTYGGFRISVLYEVNDDWKVTVAHARQSLDVDGVFFDDPTLDDFEIQRFEQDEIEDDFHNTAWSIEGRLGALEALYTGAYTDRATDQRAGYTDYLFVSQFLPYYICDASVSYPSAGSAPSGTCQPPNLYVNSTNRTKVQTHELRFNTPAENRWSATFGAFYMDLKLRERNDFTYPGSVNILASDGISRGFGPNFSAEGASVSDTGQWPRDVLFRNDVLRTDQQFGIYGEGTFDVIPETLAITFGARYYDVEVDLRGSAAGSFGNLGAIVDNNPGNNLDEQFDGDPNPDTAQTDGFIFKGNVTWTPTPDLLFYATYSEGFRPGVLNRPGGAMNADGSFTVPFVVDTDDVTNYELGWKTTLLDGQLRFNGNVFYVDISQLQISIFDPNITNQFFSDNAANAEILGVEGDLIWAPDAVPGLTIAGAFSMLDTEITEVITPTGDVLKGEPLAFAPEFQGNLRARYEWDATDDLVAHVMPQIVYSASSFTDVIEVNKLKLDSWFTLGLSAGVTADQWSFEIYGDNLTNERQELSGNFQYDRPRVVVGRPLTVGARFSVRY